LALGCRNLNRFDSRNGDAYCGSIVGQGSISTGFEEPEWAGTKDMPTTLGLTLNTDDLFKKDGVPALVTSNDATFGPCAPNQRLFDGAKLRTIEKARGDRISGMRISDDHEEDVVTFVDSSCSGSMVGILSLINNGNVELRLLRPTPEPTSDPPAADATPRFGLFLLARTESGCGF
jgi:hypothetical protein